VTKRLLMVANPFPPMASGGNNRLLRFLRHLPSYGWETTVLTARAEGPEPEPADVRIVRAAAPNPERAYALARRLRRRASASPASAPLQSARLPDTLTSDELPRDALNTSSNDATMSEIARATSRRAPFDRWLFVPDQYVGWIGPAVWQGRQLLQRERFDVIFSSCPRPSAHLTAAALARLSGLPWVADYRDPWTTNQFRRYPTVLHRAAHAGLEKIAVAQAAAVTAVNEPILADLRARFPELTGRPTEVLPNGYDRDEPVDEVRLGPGFWLVHTGRLYGRDEQLRLFLEAFATLPNDVHVLFLGVAGSMIRARAQALSISDRVHVEPYAPHRRALGYQRAADVLVLLTGRQPESLSSKVFEYLIADKPIFAVTPRGSAAQELLDEAGASRCASPDEPLAGPLAQFVADAREGHLGVRDERVVARYDAAMLTCQLAELLDGLTG